jgi:hypothetical protein
VAGETFATSAADDGAQGFVIGGCGDDIHDDGLAGQGMGLAAHAAVGDARDA